MSPRLSNPKASSRRRCRGWTLGEMLVAVGVGAMMLAALATTYVFVRRAFDATCNYEELDRQSRNALDTMTRDIRQAGRLTSYATNALTFTNLDGTTLSYSWSTNTGLLTYNNQLSASPASGTLLKDCVYLNFSVFQRTPSNGTTITFWPLTNPVVDPTPVKVIVINWVCRKTNYLTLDNSESVETAKVVLRN